MTDRLPRSRLPDPVEAPPLRWGVIGGGWIAERFVDALQSKTRQQVVAVGSRSPAGATAFAGRFDIPRPHGSYEDVLIEKPLALNAREARELQVRAAELDLYCAEAMWTLFTPKFDVIRQVLDSGCSASYGRSSSISANGSPTITGSCGPSWPADRCLTSAPTRYHWLTGSWGCRSRSLPAASRHRAG